VKDKKVGIAGDDVGSTAADPELKKLIVSWISARSNTQIGIYQLRLASQSGHKASDYVFIDVFSKLLSAEHVI